MAKNPVFPLYYNDIDRSTRDWSDEEFGAYMRLLMHQWDKGSLPKDYQRLTRIATSLSTTWDMLKDKFPQDGEVLKNRVLEDIRTKYLKHREKQKSNIEKRYQTSTKHTTKKIPLEDEYEIEKENIVFNKNSLSPKMVEVFKSNYPLYPVDEKEDFTSCLQIAYKIAKQNGWQKESVLNGNFPQTIEIWEKIVEFSTSDNWFSTRAISDFNREFQRLFQKINSTGTKNNQKTRVVGRDHPTDKL